jgi:hypothetical protein
MARPILVVKNIADAPKRYTRVAKDGNKAVRFEFGIPFALQDIIAAKPRAKSAILGVLNDGDRFNGQKLVRLLARVNDLTVKEVVTAVEKAVY